MRLSRRLLITLVALSGFAAGALLVFVLRAEIAERVIRWQLAARGVNGDLEIERLGLHEVALRGVAVAHLRIERATLRFSPWELRRGVIESAEVEGLSMVLDFTGKGPILGELQRLVPEPGGETAWTRLPAVTLRRARITAMLPRGPLPVDLGARIVREDGDGDGAVASVTFAGNSARLTASGAARAQFEGLVPVSGRLTADLKHRQQPLSLSLRAETETLRAERPDTRFTLAGEGSLATLAAELPWPAQWRPESGTFRMTAQGRAVFPLSETPLDDLRAETALDLAFSEVTVRERGAWLRDVSGTLKGQIAYGDRLVQGQLSGDLGNARTRLRGEVASARLQLGTGYAVETMVLTGIDAHATGIETPFGRVADVALSGALSGPPTSPTGPLSLRATAPSLVLSGATARRVVLDAAFTLSPQADGFRMAFTRAGRLAIGELRLPALLPLSAVNARIESGALDITPGAAGWSVEQRAVLHVPPIAMRVVRKDANPLSLELRLRPVTLRLAMPAGAAGRLELQTVVESLLVPEAQMALRNARLNVEGDPIGPLEADLAGGSFAQQSRSPIFAPLTPQLHGTRRGNNLVLQGTLRGADGDITIAANGAHDLSSGRGRVHLALQEIVFGRDGREGETLSPLLGAVQALRGRARGEAAVTWDAAGLDTSGILNIQDLSFVRDGLEIEGASLTMTLDHLLPPHTLPHQHLTVRKIAAGVDATNVDVVFQLDTRPDGAARLVTERLALEALGGRVTVASGHIDPTIGDASLPLTVTGIDLATVIEQIGFKELQAEGRIAGTIPFGLEKGVTVIMGAQLQAEGPGRIQFRSPDTRQALAGGGDTVKLMLDALEDFQYDRLRMTLDKPVQGDSRIVVELNGRNPVVLDGQPFNFTINLAGNADPLLAALAEGRRLRNELLQPLFRLLPVPSQP